MKTSILCLITFSDNRAVHEIMWKYVVTWRMRIAYWTIKAKNPQL